MPSLMLVGLIAAAGPGVAITPNTTGLPGLTLMNNIVGALLTVGLIAAVAGMVISVIAWALGTHSANPQVVSRGKSGVLISFAAAILIGGAVFLINFFATAGAGL